MLFRFKITLNEKKNWFLFSTSVKSNSVTLLSNSFLLPVHVQVQQDKFASAKDADVNDFG